jgi:hypothetical protein
MGCKSKPGITEGVKPSRVLVCVGGRGVGMGEGVKIRGFVAA